MTEENTTEEQQVDTLFVHYIKGEPELVDGNWELTCYLTYKGESMDDTFVFQTREDLDDFASYFSRPTIEPLAISIGEDTSE